MNERIKQLIIDAKNGDEKAWEEIYNLYKEQILKRIWDWERSGIYRGSIHIDPLDIFNETWKRAYKGLSRFDASKYDDFYKWLYGIARRVFINGLRKSEREPISVDISVLRYDSNDIHNHQNIIENIEYDEIRSIIQEALKSFPKLDQEIINLHYYKGLSYAEIAERKGILEGTIKVRCHRARERLRIRLRGNKIIDEYLKD